MPTYQYACTACEHRFEAVQSFTDSALSECPECAGRLRKLYGSVGVVFKGSGFYRTDSRSGSSATAPAAASTPAAAPAAKSESSSTAAASSSTTSTTTAKAS